MRLYAFRNLCFRKHPVFRKFDERFLPAPFPLRHTRHIRRFLHHFPLRVVRFFPRFLPHRSAGCFLHALPHRAVVRRLPPKRFFYPGSFPDAYTAPHPATPPENPLRAHRTRKKPDYPGPAPPHSRFVRSPHPHCDRVHTLSGCRKACRFLRNTPSAPSDTPASLLRAPFRSKQKHPPP